MNEKRRTSYQRGTIQYHFGRWTVLYRERDENGRSKQRRHDLGLESKASRKQALIAAQAVMENVNLRNNNPEPTVVSIKFARFTETVWRSYMTNAGLKDSTIYSYDSMMRNYVLPKMGELRLQEITPEDVSHVMQGAEEKAAKYRSNLFGLLKVAFEVAKQFDLIVKSPVRSKIHKPKLEAKEKPRLMRTESRLLLGCFDPFHRLLIVVFSVTGGRLSECLAFRWMNFDEEQCTLSLTHRLWRGRLGLPKTKRSRAVIELPRSIVELLVEHRKVSSFTDPEDFIFCRSDGSPLDPDHLRNQVLYPAMDRAGIKRGARTHGFHILRHTAASILHELTGGDLKATQDFLRHSQIGTTADIYVHRDPVVARAATELLADELLAGPHSEVVN
jgi:integrase